MIEVKLGQRWFAYAGPVDWNQLPPHISSEQNFNCFKSALKTFLFRQACTILWLCFIPIFISFNLNFDLVW